jgi:hypothetical protein
LLMQTIAPTKKAEGDLFAGLPWEVWDDDDARWLMKVHESAGEDYFNKELHEQMLWWSQLPALLELAAASLTPEKKAQRSSVAPTKSIGLIEERVQEASEQAEEVGFRLAKKKEAAIKPAKKETGALAKP